MAEILLEEGFPDGKTSRRITTELRQFFESSEKVKQILSTSPNIGWMKLQDQKVFLRDLEIGQYEKITKKLKITT